MNIENNEDKRYFKQYIKMNSSEKELALNFINNGNRDVDSIKKLDHMFCGKIYDKGNGVIFYFNNEEILGKIAVVLECINPLKTSFIHGIEVRDELKDNLQVLMKLINAGKEIAIKYGAEEVKLGIRDEVILKTLEKVELYNMYDAIKMNLINRKLIEDTLQLEELSNDNGLKYLNVFNDSFSDMPHGTWLDNEGLDEFLKSKNDNKYYFMVKENNEIIGFMNCKIENDEGMFDIGLCKSYRGKALGKKLLETAINFLNNKNVNNVSLIVIEKNKIAYDMYKKRGFVKEHTISNWIEL